jgi:ribosomal protein S18 acetylase RimI-like enzyme
VNDRRAPLFCSTELTARIEQSEVRLVAGASQHAHRRSGASGFVTPISGGVASFAEAGSPFNKVAGLGFAGVPSGAALDEIEWAFAACGSPVQVELAHLADPAIGALLTGRGYRLESFENVLGLTLPSHLEQVTPPGVQIRSSGDGELGPWLDTALDGFAHPDTQGVPSHEDFPRAVMDGAIRDMAAAGTVRYAAWADGVIAGAASFRMDGGVGQLAGAATAPAYRRRGIQTALLTARLADAVAAGCDLTVVTTQPGSRSQQNVQRQGFDLLYTRAVLIKAP